MNTQDGAAGPQLIEVDVANAMLAEVQLQRDKAQKDGVEKAATIFSLGRELQSVAAELKQERDVIKPALLTEIDRLKAEVKGLGGETGDEAETPPTPPAPVPAAEAVH